MFYVEESGFVDLDIYNIRGQKVRKLMAKFVDAGEHRVIWDGRDDDGDKTGSGVFFGRLKFGDRIAIRKLLMLK